MYIPHMPFLRWCLIGPYKCGSLRDKAWENSLGTIALYIRPHTHNPGLSIRAWKNLWLKVAHNLYSVVSNDIVPII